MRFLLSSTLPPPRACRMLLTRSVTAGRSDSRCFTRYWGSCAVCAHSSAPFSLVLPLDARQCGPDRTPDQADKFCRRLGQYL